MASHLEAETCAEPIASTQPVRLARKHHLFSASEPLAKRSSSRWPDSERHLHLLGVADLSTQSGPTNR